MTEQEARDLLLHIKAHCGKQIRGMQLYQLGNGEYVIRCARPDAVHFWSLQDFMLWYKTRAA